MANARTTLRIAACLAVTACGADQATTTSNTPSTVKTVAATVTGTTWTMTNVRATYLPNGGTLILTAIDSLHTPAAEITFYLDGVLAAGVYTPQNNPAMVADFSRNDSTWDTLMGKLGSITLTAVSATRLTGSFDLRVSPDPALSAADSANVLAVTGHFDVTIP